MRTLALLVIASLACPGLASARGFDTAKCVGINSAPTAMTTGDLDGDGDLDVVFAVSSSVKIGRNTAGSLALEAGIPVKAVRDLALVDLDRDGSLEIAVLTSSELSTWSSELTPLGSFPVEDAAAFAWADVQNDGWMDVVVAGAQGVRLTLLLGLDGQMEREVQADPAVDVAFAMVSPTELVLAVAGDDSSRLLRIEVDEQMQLKLDDKLIPELAYADGGALSVLWADLVGEGNIDALFVYDDSILALHPNQLPVTHELPDFEASGVVAAADVLGSGRSALLLGPLCDPDDAELCDGDPAQLLDGLELSPIDTVSAGQRITAAVLADLDGDGRADAVLAGDSPGVDGNNLVEICWSLSRGEGVREDIWPLPNHKVPSHVSVGDVNNDGRMDLAISAGSSVLLMPRPEPQELGPSSGHTALADLNGDGALDLVTYGLYDPTAIHFTVGGEIQNEAGWTSKELGANVLSVADVDGDGAPDLVSTESGTPAVFLGPFANAFDVEADEIFPGIDALTMAWGDIDGDRRLDLAVGTKAQGLMLFHNASEPGTILLEPLSPLPEDGGSIALRMVDWNGDGATDLLDVTTSSASLYANLGGALVFIWRSSPFASSARSAEVLDWDGDGDLDLAVQSYDDAQVWLQAASGPLFGPAPGIALPSVPLLGSADVDGDGRPELIGAGADGVIFLSAHPGAVQASSSPRLSVRWPTTSSHGVHGATRSVNVDVSPLHIEVSSEDPEGDGVLVALEYSVDGRGGWQRSTELRLVPVDVRDRLVQGLLDVLVDSGTTTLLEWAWELEGWTEPHPAATDHPIDHDRVSLRLVGTPAPPRVAGPLTERPFFTVSSGPMRLWPDEDGDGEPNRLDPCHSDPLDDSDSDDSCDSVDLCVGDDRTGDADGDRSCDDEDCDDNDRLRSPEHAPVCLAGKDADCDGKPDLDHSDCKDLYGPLDTGLWCSAAGPIHTGAPAVLLAWLLVGLRRRRSA